MEEKGREEGEEREERKRGEGEGSVKWRKGWREERKKGWREERRKEGERKKRESEENAILYKNTGCNLILQ